ncbi:MAG: protein kinase [Ruminococcus sp.]|nr:protein kinase [Ruminococcus sp.]MCM1382445.1 serine/threonine protein kinase [Muribaculaceae bacterium]MCM1479327.1 serine/threonine protein kinase [Muribaculaceae bacterium]
MERLEIGKVIDCEEGAGNVKILQYIAEGGQGCVYKVLYKGEEKALKWYKPNTIKNEEWFKRNLMKNINEGAPTSSFLWPLAMTEKYKGSFGYVMDLRPEGYYDFSKYLLCRGIDFKSVDAMINAAINIVDGFRILHNMGYSYQDLNDGNFFIHPDTGDVLICDNDNVAPYGENSGIAGKCRYMAPSIVMGRKLPEKRTDEFSLAVILFLLLIRNHPLEGQLVNSKAVLTEQYQRLYYGEKPVFIADPEDASNRPVIGIHNNFMKRWSLMPDYIQQAFIKAFSKEVMIDDKHGITEKEWIKFLLRFKAEVNLCPECGLETRFTDEIHKCACCGKDIDCFGYLHTSEYKIPMFSKKELPLAYVTGEYSKGECRTPCIRISLNKTRTKCAIQNKGESTWICGSEKVAPGEQIIAEDNQEIKIEGNIVKVNLN